MSRPIAFLVLFAAAVLEVGGDAIIRAGLHRSQVASKLALFLLGACILFAYGWVVNAPPWEFGKLLGVYVVFIFLVAQLISFLAFGQKPSTAVLLGGMLIVAGGLVIGLERS